MLPSSQTVDLARHKGLEPLTFALVGNVGKLPFMAILLFKLTTIYPQFLNKTLTYVYTYDKI